MSDQNDGGLTREERLEIDAFYSRLSTATHYELLGIEASAEVDAIHHAFGVRTRRFRPGAFAGRVFGRYQSQLEAILRAIEEAHDVLGDPVRRFLYDQELASGGRPPSGRPRPSATPAYGTLPPAASPSSSRIPSAAFGAPPSGAPKGLSLDPTDPLAPIDVAPRPAPRSDVPSQPPPRWPTPPPPPPTARNPLKQTGPQPITPRATSRQTGTHTPVAPTPVPGRLASASIPPAPRSPSDLHVPAPITGAHSSQPPPDSPRVLALEAQVTTLQGEVSQLLTEVERLAVAVQLVIARSLEADSVGVDQVVSAGQALVSTRVVVGSMLARREEAAGHWEAAATFWQRAARARPGEVMLLVHAANALRKAGTDLDAAEALARQAIQRDPDCADAHSALAVIEARRKRSSP